MNDTGPITLMTVKQVAAALSISASMVYKEVRLGRLRVVKIGACVRFRSSDIALYLGMDGDPIPAVTTVPLCAVCGKAAALEINFETKNIPVCSAVCAYNFGRGNAQRLIGKITRSARRL